MSVSLLPIGHELGEGANIGADHRSKPRIGDQFRSVTQVGHEALDQAWGRLSSPRLELERGEVRGGRQEK